MKAARWRCCCPATREPTKCGAPGFAADKHDVVLVARGRDRLEGLATRLAAEQGVVARVIAIDLAVPTAPQRIADELAARDIEIEFLVNNAGFGTTGRFVERDL